MAVKGFAPTALDGRNIRRVTIGTTKDFDKNDLVVVASGVADKNAAAASAGVALALEPSSDDAYEGTKTEADVACLVGQEIEMDIKAQASALTDATVGTVVVIDSTGQAVDPATTTNGVFKITRLGTLAADKKSGTVWGVFQDSACF